MKTYAEKRFFEWHEDDVSVTLRNKSGSYGGGRDTDYIFYQDIVGSLCATDYKWVQQEQVIQGKLVIMKCDHQKQRNQSASEMI